MTYRIFNYTVAAILQEFKNDNKKFDGNIEFSITKLSEAFNIKKRQLNEYDDVDQRTVLQKEINNLSKN